MSFINFKIFVPKEKKFFPLFDNVSSNLKSVSELFIKVVKSDDNIERNTLIKEIKSLENIGDNYTHDIFIELNKTFITPFDREDIQLLASSLDDVVDCVNSACQKIEMYKPKKLSLDLIECAELLLESVNEIEYAVKELKNLKHTKNMMDSCIKINSIENRADDIYHKSLADMFQNEKDAIELIKSKEIIKSVEMAHDKCEDVADVLKSIIIKNN